MKKLLVLGLTLATASLASASELWWTIGDVESGITWGTAVLMEAVNGTNKDGNKIEGSVFDYTDQLGYYDGTIDSAKSFYVELQQAGERVAGSQLISGAALASYAYNGGMTTPQGVYTFTGFTSEVVPEPTTGLLMLFGLAGLALKRRRA